MVGGAIPAYRLPQAQIAQDLAVLERLGVELRYGVRVGDDVTVAGLLADGYAAVFVAVGAQRGKRLGLPGEDAAGVLDGVEFLRLVREGRAPVVGPRVGVVGAGDTAMDCARSARRAGAASVQLVYRRTIDRCRPTGRRSRRSAKRGSRSSSSPGRSACAWRTAAWPGSSSAGPPMTARATPPGARCRATSRARMPSSRSTRSSWRSASRRCSTCSATGRRS